MENGALKFREMNDSEFERFLEVSVMDYSRDLEKSGLNSKEDALENSRKQFNELLPQGRYTRDNYIYMIVNSENEEVGTV